MKSIKYFATAIFCAVFCGISLYYAYTTNIMMSRADNPIYTDVYFAEACFFVLLAASLVFFILGWVTNDKPSVSKSQLEEKNDDNKN